MTFLNRHRSRIRPVGPFAPSSLFFGGIPGAWYDPTDVNVNWRVNLLTYTEQFDNAAWTKNDGSITATNIVAPDGTPTADAFTGSGVDGYLRQVFPSLGAGTYTASVWLKVPSGTLTTRLGITDGGGSNAGNISVALTTSWQRFQISVTRATAGVGMFVGGFVTLPAGSVIHAWGAQLEVGSTATTYQQIVTPEITYAATQVTNLFQDSTGTTPVTAVEQPVGLILDKSQGLAQTNLATFTFDTGTDGFTAALGSIASVAGALEMTTSSVNGYAFRDVATVAGVWYRVRAPLRRVSGSGSVRLRAATTGFANSVGSAPISSATPTTVTIFYLATTATSRFYIQQDGSGLAGDVYAMDEMVIDAIAGNHASQSTAASRPTYRARYNLLTDSENFGPPWSVDNATVTTDTTIAPDGTLTADTLTPSGSLTAFANRVYRVPANLISGATYVVSVWAKSSVANAKMTLSIFNYGGQVFTLTSSWQRYSVSIVAGGTSPNTNIYAGEVNPTTGAIISTNVIQIWGAQLMTAADAAATGNAYQRIAAATVYDTSPIFRPYLAFDGMDDSLSTAAINFTSTSKLTLFAGVSKAQDSVYQIIGELTASADANAGSFNFATATAFATGRGYYYQLDPPANRVFGDGSAFTTAAPTTDVVSVAYDRTIPSSTNQIQYRIDAQGPSSAGLTLQGVGASGAFANAAFFIGRRNNASNPLNGRLYSLIVRGAASSVTEIADTELWVNARTGAF